MDIRLIEELSEGSPVGDAVRDIVRTQLGNEQSLQATVKQIGFDSGKTLLLGGFVDGKLATMNAFMPQTFRRDGQAITGYQSGFSATGGEHRGKGYWPKLLSAGMDILKEQGGDFVYGFPNPVSHPLFVKKLDFQTAQMWKTVLPVFASRVLRLRCDRPGRQFEPDVRELMALKSDLHPDLVTLDTPGYQGFGKPRQVKGVRMIEIGALSSDSGDLGVPIRRLAKSAGAAVFRFEASEASCFNSGFVLRRPSRPVIFKSLHTGLGIDDVMFVGGLSDDY